ncbi:hypothetical protein GCM10009592_07500 [Brachybacterium rhamnosum]|uniref:Uncharacterized protein n=1 Tax=Brachybacterium rhamnosum TaxID=173361 RepID=A0ABW4PUA2_9MICO
MHHTISRRAGGRRTRILALAAVGILAAGGGTAAGLAGGVGAAAAPADVAAGTGDVAGGTGDAAAPVVDVPDSWDGTISASEIGSSSSYVAVDYLYGASRGASSMSAATIAGQEFFAGSDAVCSGKTVLDGRASRCTFTDDDSGEQLRATVRLVATPFAGRALIVAADDQDAPRATVPEGAQIGYWGADAPSPARVTASDLEHTVINAVMMGSDSDGDLPEDLAAGCTVLDRGAHGTCTITGSGGGDGTYYLTQQTAIDGGPGYVVTALDVGGSGVTLPSSWAGTVSTSRVGNEGGGVGLEHLYQDRAVTSVSARSIAGGEYFGGYDAVCTGKAVLDGRASHCTSTNPDTGEKDTSTVRLVRTPFGRALLVLEDPDAAQKLPVAKGAEISLSWADAPSASEATAEDIEEASINAVMLGRAADGDLPAGITSECTVLDEGHHAVCTLDGTDGADGTYYATSQVNEDLTYVFTALPED